jgi:predicted transposase/invertase (TIGR01784 family)
MSKNAVRLKLDIVFKKTFTEDGELLQGLLSDLLQLESIKNITIRNSEILPDSLNGKYVRMDLNLEADGRLINVELQYRFDPDYKDRALFNWSKLYGGELKSGGDYKDLKPSICINILNQNIFDCKEYHSCFAVMEKTRHEELTDKCAIHFFELKKIGKNVSKDDKMRLWLQLINADTEEELAMLEQTGVAPIQKAVKIIRGMGEDMKMQELARMREKALIDETSALSWANLEGRREGRAEGRREEVIEIARNLVKKNRPIDEIAAVTGLSEKEIAELT